MFFAILSILMFVPGQPISASSAEDTLTFKIVYVTGNKSCYYNDNQKMNEYFEFAKKYLNRYGVSYYSYGPSCLSMTEYENYQPPSLTDILIVIYNKNTGREILQDHDMGGFFRSLDYGNVNGLRIETCDCDGFNRFNEQFWVFSHELSHFVLFYLGYDRDVWVDWVHDVQSKYYAYCGTQGDTTYWKCNSLYTKIEGYSRDYKVMAINSDAYGKTPPQAKFVNSIQTIQENTSIDYSEEFKTLNVEGTSNVIYYKVAVGEVLGIKPDFEANSIILQMISPSDGKLEVALSRHLIESANEYGDDNFFVLIDNKEISPNERSDENYRYLTFSFPSGSDKIEIIGTKLKFNVNSESKNYHTSQEKSEFKAYAQEYEKYDAERLKEHFRNVMVDLQKGIKMAEDSLSGLEYQSPEAQKKIEEAWAIRWMALSNHEMLQKQWYSGVDNLNSKYYDNAIYHFKQIDNYEKKISDDLKAISKAINDAENLEQKYQQSTQEIIVVKEGKVCILSWCI